VQALLSPLAGERVDLMGDELRPRPLLSWIKMDESRTFLPDFNLWILHSAYESRESAREFALNNEHHAPVF